MQFSRLLISLFVCAAMSSTALAAGSSAMMSAAMHAKVTLSAQNGSKESGAATLTQKGKDVVVVIALSNAPKSAQPAHIHPGTCAKLDPAPKYPLNNVVGGKSTTVLKNLTLATLRKGTFAINVHKSTSNLKTYVSCGNIK